MVEDPAQNKVGKAGRRGGKTVWLIAELGDTCIEHMKRCGCTNQRHAVRFLP